MQNIVIVGSTGSIGCSTLDVIRLNSDKFTVFALTAHNNVEKLLTQCIEFMPKFAVILNKDKAQWLKDNLRVKNLTTKVLVDKLDIVNLVSHTEVNIVMSAIVGSAGLVPTYSAIKANKKVLLANKESLVTAGELIIQTLKNSEAELIPVDSEHSAIFQALALDNFSNNQTLLDTSLVNKIILTASGGPFRTYSQHQLTQVTPELALKHPNWVMGKKISIDSSTLMNKGLEVIEAHWLFNQVEIDVIVHPQSIIHSMVEYIDGSILAQLGAPDMKTPIAYALAYPKRIKSGSNNLDFKKYATLTFEEVDYQRFPCLKLAYEALEMGGAMPAILNAANEVAVEAFLQHQIAYNDIYKYIHLTMSEFPFTSYTSLDEVLAIDQKARNITQANINK